MDKVYVIPNTTVDPKPTNDDEQGEDDEFAKDAKLLVDRLRICEDRSFAFSRISLHTWHGAYLDRRPRIVRAIEGAKLSAEDKASESFICLHTTPSQDGNFAAVLDCYSPQNRRLAIYLKKFEGERLSVYRRVRSGELRSIEPGEAIPAPETIYIAPAVQLILGRAWPIPQGNEYSLSIDYNSALAHGFRFQQCYSPHEKDGWKDSDSGVLVFAMINSGQHGGLWFRNSESGEQFVVALGVHDYDPWLDVTDIGLGETIGNIVDIYYHFCLPCQNPLSCRCRAPWNFEECVTKPLSSGLLVQAQIRANKHMKRSFEVEVKLKVVEK
ncbi:hypothetical protein BKA63DRAFT_571636 [Paraphoma chrysanthemicola]|nr:hypothetical protein BKA63DRAFT_571636 [Paraphoma chrysanthemicola]